MTSAWRHRAFSYVIVVPFAILLAFPFFWMAVTSFKRQDQIFDPKRTWSFDPTFDGWKFLFQQTKYLTWIGNTALVGGPLDDGSSLDG